VVALAVVVGEGALRLAACGFALVAILAATHDIAIDGFYLQALDKTRQTELSGVRVMAYRGALLAGGFLITLAGATSWRRAFLVAGAALALLAALHAALLPRPRLAAAPPGAGARRLSLAAFRTFFAQPRIGASLAFILLYRAGDAMMFSMSSPLLKSLGLGTEQRGYVAIIGTIASLAGSLLGGLVVARLGLRRAIFPIAVLQSAAIPLYVALAWLRPAVPSVVALVTLEQLAAGVGTAVLAVFLMRRCSDEYKATHFAIGSALMSVAATVLGGLSGDLAERVGFTAFFTIAFAASFPGVILSRRVPAD
jgi:PAT family beta-lactamase induction signal transducer AmpG